jgi:mitochondrial cardiolipin hydrolase
MRTLSSVCSTLVIASILVACGDSGTVDGSGGSGGTATGSGGSGGVVSTGGEGGTGGSTTTTGGGGTTPGYTVDSETSWHSPSLTTSVHFSPLDGSEAHVLSMLESAQTSIRLAFFNLRLDDVRDLLIAKNNAGVDVQVLLDLDIQALSFNTMAEELTAANVPVLLVDNDSAQLSTMHNKVAIVDDQVVMTGSANYSFTGLNISDEDLITIESSDLSARYNLELDEIIAAAGHVASTPYAGNPALEAWMGPEDDLHDRAVAMLDAAQDTALVAMFQLNATLLETALLDAKARGVNVIVVLDEKSATEVGSTSDETLAAAGIPVVLALNTGNMVAEMHSKFVVVDHQHVMMGSYNWTNLGSFFNDENAVIIDDAHLASRFEGKFAQLIDSYGTMTASQLGLTTGDQVVTFDVNNVTLEPGAELFLVTDGAPFAQGIALPDGSLSTMVSAGQRLDYHYEVRFDGMTLGSEAGGHTFTVPYAAGPFGVNDAFLP